MITLKAVNKALQQSGIDAELQRGKNYFYFTGPSADLFREQGVYGVYRLSDLTVEQWVGEAKSRLN